MKLSSKKTFCFFFALIAVFVTSVIAFATGTQESADNTITLYATF